MYKLLIICGPTATGKTRLGIELAKKFNGEIVSADSKQVYRGMDVGTGKDLPVSSKLQLSAQSFQLGYYEIKRVKVWLLDIVEPDYKFNVADYKKCADAIVEDIWKRKKLPIVVGGTGFYIKAIVDGIETMGVLPD
ncbi:tRNA (adenosine(37)-N6)-dimethylallyltransferase MiaA, partial [Candidatus Parcubacteria bacterium]|nr:tRNA (adenosine(37)-N6)-dimethylallyltransferase MiaA [Candidatus Parcubacteria bacterium]